MMLKRNWPLVLLAAVLVMASGVDAQTLDPWGRSSKPGSARTPANATNPNVDTVFTPVAPCRVCDSRPGFGDAGGCLFVKPFFGFPNGTSGDVDLSGICGVPTGATAVSINITAVPVVGGLGDLRVAPNPPGVFPPSSIVNYNGDAQANAADVPIGAGAAGGVRIFIDGANTQFIVDVLGYYNDVTCQAGTVKVLGQCFETALRAATNVFDASDNCRAAGGGGRLASALTLRSLRGGNPLTLSATGEWTDLVYENGVTAQGVTISNGGGFLNEATLNNNPYRCVFNPLP